MTTPHTLGQQLWQRAKNIGRAPLCSTAEPCRAPKIGQFVFPLCWRCTSIILAMELSSRLFSRWTGLVSGILFIGLGIAATLPCILDSLAQEYGVQSTNARRISTGLLFGTGCMMILFAI